MPGTPRALERWPESSRTIEGSLELQNGGLRALEEAWMTTFSFRLFLLSLVFSDASFGASRWLKGCPAAGKEVL